MMDTLTSWFEQPAVAWGLGAFSVAAVVASVLLVPRFLAKLPPGFLRDGDVPRQESVLLKVLRNLLGVLLVALGLLMLLLPGQGLLTLLVGLLLVDIPGKHALLVRMLSKPKVLSVVNRLRGKHGAPPLAA